MTFVSPSVFKKCWTISGALSLVGGAFWLGALWADTRRSRHNSPGGNELEKAKCQSNKKECDEEEEEDVTRTIASAAREDLSTLGKKLQRGGGPPAYIMAHIVRLGPGRAYSDATQRGHIPLAIAENKIVLPLLQKFVEGSASGFAIEGEDVGYDNPIGCQECREAVAGLIQLSLPGGMVNPDELILMAGISAVSDALFAVICDDGDGCLVPVPYFSGFDSSLTRRAGVQIIPVQNAAMGDNRFGDQEALDLGIYPEALDQALASSDCCRARAMLLTHPHNPTGLLYSPEALQRCMRWAAGKGIHVVVDEVYANTVWGGGGYSQPALEFVSAAESAPPELPATHLHTIHGFAKLGAAGVRIGALYSRNASVRQAVDALSHFCEVSRPVQSILARMLRDRAGLAKFLKAGKNALADSFSLLRPGLEAHGIPFIEPKSGVFVMVDLRPWLGSEASYEEEHRLWEHILNSVDVNLTPGAALHFPVPGFMRLCFAACQPNVVWVAVQRISAALESWRVSRSCTIINRDSRGTIQPCSAMRCRVVRSDAIHHQVMMEHHDGSQQQPVLIRKRTASCSLKTNNWEAARAVKLQHSSIMADELHPS